MHKKNAVTVLFDLDGTLADTEADLRQALNTTLRQHNRPETTVDLRPVISLGGNAMLQLAFNMNSHHPEFEPIRTQFLAHYANRITCHSTLFPGIEKVLEELETRKISWGIVTNKSSHLTGPLTRHLGLARRTNCIVSGDTTAHRKPHPEPLLYACRLLKCKPDQTIYIGDAQRDIAAGRAAGMKTIIALYGYIDAKEETEEWGADSSVHTPGKIIDQVLTLS